MRLVVTAVLIAALALPVAAFTSPAGAGWLHVWQAKRVVRSHAELEERPDFRIESVRRLNRSTVKVCWSEPGYLSPLDGRDYGCDLVQLRGRAFWLKDSSVMGGTWMRWL